MDGEFDEDDLGENDERVIKKCKADEGTSIIQSHALILWVDSRQFTSQLLKQVQMVRFVQDTSSSSSNSASSRFRKINSATDSISKGPEQEVSKSNKWHLNQHRGWGYHTCIDCDTCRWMAPEVFTQVDDMSAVYKQPSCSQERLKALQDLWEIVDGGAIEISADPPENAESEKKFEEDVDVIKVDSNEQLADIFTKALTAKFEYFRGQLGFVDKALLSCPTSSIHTMKPSPDLQEVQKTFPIPVDEQRELQLHSEQEYQYKMIDEGCHDSASFDDVLQNDTTHNPPKIYHEIEDTTSSTLAKKDDPADNELQMETQLQNMQLNEAPMHPEYKDHQIHALYQ
ncbi:hypothetical protein RJ640_010085 [Escallonia rubra]|uniref:Uncharacterized protein n=1 Tax=Escallonia rubra TaxID=112253 RepID=A0AA88U3P2_9ASTE|nr:hypothetical protein RJ640_010085 [Escallonia rubra]